MFRLLIAFGWLMSKVPEPLMKGVCWFLGALFYAIPSKRVQIIHSNLHHAFPYRSQEWLRKTVWRVTQRTAEMGLFTLASPHFSDKRMRRVLTVSDEVNQRFKELIARKEPIVGFAAHFSMIEAFNEWPNIVDFEFPEIAVMFRPHKNVQVNKMITAHRERTGMEMVSRKVGIRRIGEVLREKGMAILLFDQNTRDSGSLLPFFGRVSSATELPGLLAQKYKAIPIGIRSFRTDFWRASIELEELSAEPNSASMTLAANQWLEDCMSASDDLLVDWLWSHNRWRILFRPFERLGMKHKKKLVDFSKYEIRKTRFMVVCRDAHVENGTQVLDFMNRLRKSRPDVELTFVGSRGAKFREAYPDTIDCGYDLPTDQRELFQLAKALRDCYLDLILVLEDDQSLQQFAQRTKVPQRFGVKLHPGKNKYLTDLWTPEDVKFWKMCPEWIEFGKHFGLEVEDRVSIATLTPIEE